MIFGRKKNKAAPAKGSEPSPKIDIESASAEQLLDIVCDSTDVSQRQQALTKITDLQDLALILTRSKFPAIRLAVAERISDEKVMRSCYGELRQKDKDAARILKAKLDVIDAEKQEFQAQEEALHGVMKESALLATGVWSPTYNARYQALLGRWQHMEDDCSMAEKLRFQTNQQRIQETLEEHRPRLEAPGKQVSVCESLELICGALQQASLMEAEIACAEWGDIIAADVSRWEEAIALSEPEDELKQRYENAKKSLDAAIAVGLKLHTASHESEDFSAQALAELSSAVAKADWKMGDVPIWFFELNALIEEVRQNQAAQQKEQDQQLGELHKAFASLRRAIADGRLIPAKSMLARLESKVEQASVADRERYKEQLASLTEELGRLIDWQDFATKPKYADLCEQMEQLAKAEIDQQAEQIEARVESVKALQAAWKELGRSDASETFWDRFQAAGHTAYEPAKIYFEALQQKREDNVLKRQALCEQLTAELEQAIASDNWQALEKQVSNAQRAWHNYRGVERKEGKLVKERFDHLLERVKLTLEPQYEAGIAAKQALIQKMEALLAGDINQHALNQTKQLQAAWKVSGITPKSEDQALWASFNGLCKQVYDADREQRNTRIAEENQAYNQARTIINDIKGLSAETAADHFQALQAAFDKLQWQERDRDADKLKTAYSKACDQYEASRDKLAANAGKNDLIELQRLGRLCASLEQSEAAIDEAGFLEAWQGHSLENPRWLKALEKRKTKALAGEKPSEASTHARRLLCVQLEIVLDKASPSTDKPLRMEYQLSQLQNRNRAPLTAAEALNDIVITWHTSLAALPEHSEALEQRFAMLTEATGK